MNASKPNYTGSLALLVILFFLWGFVTSLNDILIPFLQNAFNLTQTKALLVQFAFFIAYFAGSLIYFLISLTKGDPINKIGYKNGVILGLLISATGTGLFYPAAEIVSYPFFLLALFVVGFGFSLLQISANPYVSILGSESSASSRLNLSQGFNSIGTTTAPLIGAWAIFHFFSSIDASQLNDGKSDPDAVKIPYLILTGILLGVAALIMVAPLPAFTNNEKIPRGQNALRLPSVRFGMLAIFFYVGAEVSIGSNLIRYFKEPSLGGMDEGAGAIYVALYWGGMMIGRFLGAISASGMTSTAKRLGFMVVASVACFLFIWYAVHLKNENFTLYEMWPYAILVAITILAFQAGNGKPSVSMALFGLFAAALLFVTSFTDHQVAVWSVVGIGLFNSIMWSNIFTLAIENLGPLKSQASALLVMMVIGGALFPLAQGLVVDYGNVQISFLIPVVAYLYLSWYGWTGYKIGKR